MRKIPSASKFKIVFIAMILLIFVTCAGYLFLASRGNATDPYVADIYQNGTLIKSIPLYQVTSSYQFTVTGENGAENVIEVRHGTIAVISASCPDKICVRQGFQSTSVLPIICLPNRLVIRLRKIKDSEEPDALTY